MKRPVAALIALTLTMVCFHETRAGEIRGRVHGLTEGLLTFTPVDQGEKQVTIAASLGGLTITTQSDATGSFVLQLPNDRGPSVSIAFARLGVATATVNFLRADLGVVQNIEVNVPEPTFANPACQPCFRRCGLLRRR